jgi:uncharacterized protein YhbP (UPF0306 family)
MNQNIIEFIKSRRICVCAIEMLDSSLHAATLHFAATADGSMFFFSTSPESRKGQALSGREVSKASVVVGFEESNMKTLQMDGEARLMENDEAALFKETYFGKFPEKAKMFPDNIFVVFIPKWWRFTDWTGPEGKTIWLSTDESDK